MAGRHKLYKDEVSLARAMDVFWRYGYEGSSMSLLLEEMKLNKGSLYYSFGSKRELFLRVLDQYSQQQLMFLETKLAAADNVIIAIQEVFKEMIRESDRKKVNKGCLLVNTLGELSFRYPGIRDVVAHKLRLMEEVFLKYLNVARGKGQLDQNVPTVQIARHLITLWSGIQVNRRLYDGDTDLSEVLQANLSILDQYIN